MKLHAHLQSAKSSHSTPAIVLMHGLFGSLDNLGVLARDLGQHHTLLQVDLRNHGGSAHSKQMNYPAMAADLLEAMDQHHITDAILIGHSMGGKVAMMTAALAPLRVIKLVVIDIAPVAYQERHHDQIFTALKAVTDAGAKTRQQAAVIMREHLDEEGVIQFLLKSFHESHWTFNLPVLWDEYQNITGWQTISPSQCPALFIRGADSSYVDERYRAALLTQFPRARAHIVAGAGHWVHAQKPDAVLRAIHRFIDEPMSS